MCVYERERQTGRERERERDRVRRKIVTKTDCTDADGEHIPAANRSRKAWSLSSDGADRAIITHYTHNTYTFTHTHNTLTYTHNTFTYTHNTFTSFTYTNAHIKQRAHTLRCIAGNVTFAYL